MRPYDKAEAQVVLFDNSDVVTTSEGCWNNGHQSHEVCENRGNINAEVGDYDCTNEIHVK